jgi:hypothetical protein
MTSTMPVIPRNLRADGKDDLGRFATGNAGKPRGAISRVNRELFDQVRQLAPTAIEKLREAVNKSEKWAVEFVLNRVIPQTRAVELFDATPDDIKQALISGELTAAECRELSEAIAKLKGITEIDEHRELLSSLETLLQQSKR